VRPLTWPLLILLPLALFEAIIAAFTVWWLRAFPASPLPPYSPSPYLARSIRPLTPSLAYDIPHAAQAATSTSAVAYYPAP
jgi:hypothetical protein